MPIFRYHCSQCGKEFELLLPRADAPAACPGCGSEKPERQLNRIGAIKSAGPASCAMRNDCPSAGGHSCGCGCGCGGHHH